MQKRFEVVCPAASIRVLEQAVGVGDCGRISRSPFVLDARCDPVFNDNRSCGRWAGGPAPGRTRPPAPHALGEKALLLEVAGSVQWHGLKVGLEAELRVRLDLGGKGLRDP